MRSWYQGRTVYIVPSGFVGLISVAFAAKVASIAVAVLIGRVLVAVTTVTAVAACTPAA